MANLIIGDLFIFLTWFSLLFTISFYLGYLTLLLYFNKKGISKKETIEFTYPTVTLIIPVYNEEKVIEKKIHNIDELDYPTDKLTVIFIDGQSKDGTAHKISELSKISKKNITLIRQEKRDGYTRAVIQGILQAKSEIVVATDGGSYHYTDTLLHLVKHFADPQIGAVTGKEVVMGNKENVGLKLEQSYRSLYDFMRKAETQIDSTPDSKGEILAVRLEICKELIHKLKLSPNASFDSCVPYQAKLMGFRTIYDEKAKYYEYAPASFSDRTTQQVRRATLLIGALFLFKNMLFKKKNGKFGSLILPIHFVMYCIIPSMFLLGIISLAISTLMAPLAVVFFWIVTALLLMKKVSRTLLISFTQSQIALLAALIKLAQRKESLFIETIPSTRANT
jgi:poly-beta-1,6-N-acetyl-D-glucosamine synthase